MSSSLSPPKVRFLSPRRSIRKARKAASTPANLYPIAIRSWEQPNLFWITLEELKAFQDLFHKEMVQLAKNRELQPFLPKDHLGIWLAFLDKGHRWHRVKIEAKTEGDSQQSQWQFRDLDSAQIYTSSDETKFYQIPARWKAVAPQSILLEVPNLVPIQGSLSLNKKVWQFRSQTWSPQSLTDVQNLILNSVEIKAHLQNYIEDQSGYTATGEIYFQLKDQPKNTSLSEFLVAKGHAKLQRPMKIRTPTPEPAPPITIEDGCVTVLCRKGQVIDQDDLGEWPTLTDWLINHGKTTFLDEYQ